jgi:NitT/TauT family transport system substrate-binding protein
MTPVSQVMNWFAQSSMGGFFAALKNGDYEKQNLQMTIEQGGPGVSSLPTVASGKYMLGMSAADQILLARQEGVPVVVVYATFHTNPQGLMFHKSHPVNDFKDLNGRKVYVSPNGTYWLYMVKKFNLDKVEEHVYRGQLATFLAEESSVTQCFVSSEPPAATQQGYSVGALLNADSGYNPYANVMFAMEQTVKEKPDVIQAYVTASLQGWKSYAESPEPIVAFMKEFNKDYDVALGLKAAEIEKPLLTGKSYDPKLLGTMTEARWKELHDQMREVGVLKSDLDVKAVFDARFIEAAHQG